MLTFAEAIRKTTYADGVEEAKDKVSRQQQFIADMATTPEYLNMAGYWLDSAAQAIDIIPTDLLDADAADDQVGGVMRTLINSVFLWGLCVGMAMERQELDEDMQAVTDAEA